MTIATAVQRGRFVYVYGEKNKQLFTKAGDLHGYTASTVSIKNGAFVYTYNDKGRQVGVTSAR